MKKNLLLFILCLACAQNIFSQCGTSISGTTNFCGPGCNGNVTFTSTSGTPPYTLVVTGGPTVMYSGSYNWTNICPGTYPYTVTDAASSCTDNGTITIVSFALPNITITPPTANICMGDSVQLVPGGGVTYNWSPMTYINFASGYFSPPVTTVYTVVGVDANSCSGSATATIMVDPLPLLIPPAGPAMCYGMSVILSVSGASTYSWSPATGLSATTGSTVTANPLATTTYTIVGTSATACNSSSTVTVTVDPLPGASFTMTNESCIGCCDGSLTALPASLVAYQWSNAATTQTINNLCTGTYSVTIWDFNACTSSASATIGTGNCNSSFSVYPNVSIPHNYWVVNNATGTPPLSYLWTWGDATSDNIANPTHTYAAEGYYQICLGITDASGCSCTNCWSAALTRVENANTMITVTVVPSLPTGEQNVDEDAVILFPNPAANELSVSGNPFSANSVIEIYNVLGEKVFSEQQPTNNNQQTVDISTFTNGIYFVRVKTANGENNRKLIVQH